MKPARGARRAATGWVLAGGRSSRFGADKALATHAGAAYARRVADSMTAAGARRVTLVGGSTEVAARLGLARVEDDHPGCGPLGAILTALRSAGSDHAWVGACDLPLVVPATWTALDAALDDAAAAVACDERSVAWLLVALRAAEALVPLEAAWAAGERAPHRALGWAVRVPRPGDELRNVNRPEDAPEPS